MMPYSLASSADMTKSRSVSLWILLDRLAGVVGEDLVEQVAHAQDLLGLDLDVGGLAAAAPPYGWWSRTRACGRARRLPLVPAASSTAAADAAWPKQIVAMSGLMNCIVS